MCFCVISLTLVLVLIQSKSSKTMCSDKMKNPSRHYLQEDYNILEKWRIDNYTIIDVSNIDLFNFTANELENDTSNSRVLCNVQFYLQVVPVFMIANSEKMACTSYITMRSRQSMNSV